MLWFNDLKFRKVCRTSNQFDHVSGCISFSVFSSLFGVSVGTPSFSVRLKICALNVGIKKHKPIIKKKIKQHNNIALLAKTKLNNMHVYVKILLYYSMQFRKL